MTTKKYKQLTPEEITKKNLFSLLNAAAELCTFITDENDTTLEYACEAYELIQKAITKLESEV